jgi:two-component system chemotaxis response regulator CheY
MKALVADDDLTSRILMRELLRKFGVTHVACNGKEAVDAAKVAIDAREPYTVICMDIMMPEMDGQQALKEIRAFEEESDVCFQNGAKIIMTTALRDRENVSAAFRSQCDGYLVKPIDRTKLVGYLREFGQIK